MASGIIYGSTNNQYIFVKVEWSSTADENNNRSTITARLYAQKTSSSTQSTKGTGTWYLTINGQTRSYSFYIELETNNAWREIGSMAVTVDHDAEGNKTVPISATGSIANTTYRETYLSGNAVMDSIPRQTRPVFDADSKDFGQSVAITLDRADGTFYHAISYTWNEITTIISENVEAEDPSEEYVFPQDKPNESIVNFAIPTSFIEDIPNAASGEVFFTVTTYRGDGSIVGSASASLVCTVPASLAPVINSIILTDSGTQIPSQWGIFVSGMSVLHVKVNVSGQAGATISSYSISALDQVKNSNDVDIATIYQSGTIRVAVTVTDSRGLSTSNSTAATANVYDYNPPDISNFRVVRCNESGTPVENGSYARITLACSIVSLGGHNAMEIRIYKRRPNYRDADGEEEDWSQARVITPTGDSLDASYRIADIDTQYTYAIKVEVQDAIATSRQEGMLASEGAIISWLEGGIGFAIGKVAEREHTTEFQWGILAPSAELDQPLGVPSGGTGGTTQEEACNGIGAVYENGTWDVSHLTATPESAASFVNSIKGAILNAMYPVGSLYITVNATPPASLLGGTWEQIKDRFLLAAGDNHAAGGDGGAESYTLIVGAHQHSISGYSEWGANRIAYGNGHLLMDTQNGGGFTQEIPTMPPYMAVYIWKRIA